MAEVVSVLTLTAVLAAVSARSFQSSAVSTMKHAVTAKTVALELTRMRRLAIQSGESHGIRFLVRNERVTGYDICKWTKDRRIVSIEPTRMFGAQTSVGFDHALIEFNPEGQSQQHSTIRLTASRRQWEITVIPVTGMTRLREVEHD